MITQSLYKAAFLLPLATLALTDWMVKSEELTCNGLSNLCNIPADKILYGMPHNAMSSPSAGFIFYANHIEDPIVASLDSGYRGLSLDLCNCNGNLQFCHGGDEVGCGIGRRDPVDTFDKVNDWIIDNPRNVLVIHMQMNSAADEAVTLADMQSILDQVPNGFADRFYHHDPTINSQWPTLEQLIRQDKQVIFFYVSGPNGNGQHPDGLHYFYDYGMQTDYSYSSVDDLRDRTLGSCSLRNAGGTRDWFLMNAFVTRFQFGVQVAPSRDAAEEINTIEFSEPLLDYCEEVQGKKVNIIMVDFWHEGNLPALVNKHNAALVAPMTPTPTGEPSETPTTAHSNLPTTAPSAAPSPIPTTGMPSGSSAPTEIPATAEPSGSPSSMPSDAPSLQPSSFPSHEPSSQPSNFPSHEPSLEPSSMPTNVESAHPSPAPSFRGSTLFPNTPSNNGTNTNNERADPTDSPSVRSGLPAAVESDESSSTRTTKSSFCTMLSVSFLLGILVIIQ